MSEIAIWREVAFFPEVVSGDLANCPPSLPVSAGGFVRSGDLFTMAGGAPLRCPFRGSRNAPRLRGAVSLPFFMMCMDVIGVRQVSLET